MQLQLLVGLLLIYVVVMDLLWRNPLYFFLSLTVISSMGYYFHTEQYYQKIMVKARHLYMMANTLYLLINVYKGRNQEPVSVKVKSTFVLIKYSYRGSEYKLRLPFQHMGRMINLKVYAHLEHNETGTPFELDITQQPGIPYMFSAHDIKASKIVAKDLENDKEFIYTGNKKLGYCDELFE